MMPRIGPEYFDEAYWLDGSKSGYKPYPPAGDWIHKAIATMLARTYDFPFDGRVLDVGGCFGYQAGALADLTSVSAFVVDASHYAVERADKRVTAVCLDVGTMPLPFPTAHFDMVVSIETLEHVYEPHVPFVLSEISRVLRPYSPLCATIALASDDTDKGPDRSHQTMKARAWWHELLTEAGLAPDDEAFTRIHGFHWHRRPLAKSMGWHVFAYRKQ